MTEKEYLEMEEQQIKDSYAQFLEDEERTAMEAYRLSCGMYSEAIH